MYIFCSKKKKKAYFNKAKPQKTKEFVNIPLVDPFHWLYKFFCLCWLTINCLPVYSELSHFDNTVPVLCTYLQWTIVGSTIPMRRCRTLRTNSRKSAGSSGTLWSGQAMYCMCDMCRSSLVCQQGKYNKDTITSLYVIKPKKFNLFSNCQNFLKLIQCDRQVFNFFSLKFQYYWY